jgi:hypothetical protein
MKTGAMRRFVRIDTEGSEPGKAVRIAKAVGHGVESVSKREVAIDLVIDCQHLIAGSLSSSHPIPWSYRQRPEQTRELQT